MHSKPAGPHSSATRTDRLQADLHIAAAVSLLTTMWPTAHSIEMSLHHWRVGTGPASLDTIFDSTGEVLWSYRTDPDPLPPTHLTPRFPDCDRVAHFGRLRTAAELHLDTALRHVGDPAALDFTESDRENRESWHVVLPTTEQTVGDHGSPWRRMTTGQLRPGDRIAFTDTGPAFTLLWNDDTHSRALTDEPALVHRWVVESAMPVTLLAHRTYRLRHAPRVVSQWCLLCHRAEPAVFDAAISSRVLAAVCGLCTYRTTPAELRHEPHNRPH